MDLAGCAVLTAVQQHHAGLGRGDVPAEHQGEVLVHHVGRVEPRVLHHMAGHHPHHIFAGRRRPKVDPFDVVDVICAQGVGHRFAVLELVAPIDPAVRPDEFQVQIVHQGRNGGRKSGRVRVGQGDFERIRIGAREDQSPFINLAIRQQHRLIQILVGPQTQHDFRQVHPAPAFLHVWRGARAEPIAQVDGGMDQRGFDQSGRGGWQGVSLAVKLDKDRRRSRDVGGRLARAAHVQIILVDRQPGVPVLAKRRTQRGNPGPRRHHVRFDPPVFARAATGEISHRVRSGDVIEEIDPIVLRSAHGNDVLGHRRAADGLRAGGVACGEHQNIGLVSHAFRIGVAHQLVEHHRADVIPALRVIAPTVRANLGARLNGGRGQSLKRRRRLDQLAVLVKDALHDNPGPGRHP